jgi:hypothetical protein
VEQTVENAELTRAEEAAWTAALEDYRRTGYLPDPPLIQADRRLEARITELWGHLNAATYRFLELVAEYDRSGGWERHGLANCAQWLNWQCGIGKLAAREKVRVARALEHLPLISESFARGELSYSKVRAMTRIATPENEAQLLNIARYGTANHVEKLVRKYRWVERLREAEQAHERHRMRRVKFFYDEDGSMIIQARLPPEVGAVVRTAIEAAMEALEEEERAAPEPDAVREPGPEARPGSEAVLERASDPPLELDDPRSPSDANWTQSSVSAGSAPGKAWRRGRYVKEYRSEIF